MSLRFTKEKFKTAMHLLGACSFAVAFGIGHGLASQDHIDSSPVITVPFYNEIPLMLDDVTFANTTIGNITYTTYVVPVTLANNSNDTFSFNSDFSKVEMSLSMQFEVTNNVITLVLNNLQLECYYNDVETETLIFDYNNGGYRSYQFNDSVSNYYFRYILDLSCTSGSQNVLGESNFVILNNQGVIVHSIDNDALETTHVNATDGTLFDMNYTSANFRITLPNVMSYDDGVDYGIDYVLTHLSQYNLYTYEQYYAYGVEQYNLGRNASQNVMSVSDMIREIFRAPISMFQNAFNFVLPLPDGTSLNVGGILTFFLTIGIALTIVSLISKIGGH